MSDALDSLRIEAAPGPAVDRLMIELIPMDGPDLLAAARWPSPNPWHDLIQRHPDEEVPF